jgi:trehalose synthase-fused probable maltokinase
VRPLGIDQSNTSVVVGERLVLKCYRRLTPGRHPEIEVTRYLAGRGLATPPVHGSADVRVGDAPPAGALLLQQYVADGRDGWLAAEEELRALLEAGDADAAAGVPGRWAPGLGEATADVHALLAAARAPGFTPHRATRADLSELRARAEARLDEALALLDGRDRETLAAAAGALRRRFAVFERVEPPPLLTRVHGDLHLGQFLHRERGVPVLVDFEGEPTRTAAERLRLASPLRDLAGLLRSVDHAAHWAARGRGPESDPVVAAWVGAARASIRAAYERRLRELDAPFGVDPRLLGAFEAEKAVYEFVYAARFLPSWLDVPRRALASAVGGA